MAIDLVFGSGWAGTNLVFGDTGTEDIRVGGTFPPLRLAAQAVVANFPTVEGEVAATLPPLVAALAANVRRQQVSAEWRAMLPALAVAATVIHRVEGGFAAALPALTFNARALPDIRGVLAATLSPLALTARIEQIATGRVALRLPALTCAAAGRYASRTARPLTGRAASPWHRGDGFLRGAEVRTEAPLAASAVGSSRWRAGAPSSAAVDFVRAGSITRSRIGPRVGHATAERQHGVAPSAYAEAWRTQRSCASGWEDATRQQTARGSRFEDGLRDRRAQLRSTWQRAGRHAGRQHGEWIVLARALRHGWHLAWQNARVPPPGEHRVVPPEPPVPERCYLPSGVLVFATLAPSSPALIFVCERVAPGREPVVVPIRRVYCVINDVWLQRVVDAIEVPALSLSLALDAASWTWGFEAFLPAAALDAVDPGSSAGPVELLARINGIEFRVFAESVSRERSFGEASVRVAGRGRNALLAAPYAPVLTFTNHEARTAQQLANALLTHNGTATGIPLGWTVDWGLTDWNVPAGVFSQQGTWIEALNAIAAAAGGYVLPHRSTMQLRVRHRYPVAPWAWDTVTPDFVLPVDAVARESLAFLEKPAYNRVFVSGQEVGILGQVTRAGTAGEVLAPMVVDPLITEATAARQRGLAVLADTGRQLEVTLRLPVLGETGMIEPGAFVEYQDGSVARLGLVRSTRVEAGWPEVWQTLAVETRV